MTIGTCGLCRNILPLVNGHLSVPRWAYERLRRNDGTAADFPVVTHDGISVISPKQLKKPILCEHCDNVILGCIEDEVSRIAAFPDGRFPAVDVVGRPLPSENHVPRLGTGLPDISRYALGLIYKSHLGGIEQIHLGAYAEPVRQYLLDTEHPLPAHIYIVCRFILPQNGVRFDLMSANYDMQNNHKLQCHHTRTLTCGILCDIFIGKSALPVIKMISLSHSNIVFIGGGIAVLSGFIEQASKAIPKGRLAEYANEY